MASHNIARAHYIYRLIDPRDDQTRYVGVTVQRPSSRLIAHLTKAKCRPRTLKDKWLNELRGVGLQPRLEVLEETTDREVEVYWINYYRMAGNDLLNVKTGGSNGFLDLSVSEATKERLRQAGIARWKNPEFRERVTSALRGHPVSEETRQRISAAKTGKPQPNKKFSKPMSQEHRQKISAFFKGRRFSYAPGTHNTARNPHLYRGERKWSAKLTEEQVREMRARFAAGGISKQELSRQYGLAPTTASGIINRKKWRHVD